MAKKATKKAGTAAKSSSAAKPKFGSPAWQAKYGRGKAKANAKKKTGK